MKSKTLIIAVSVICAAALMLFGAWVFIAYKSFSYKNQIAAITQDIQSKSSEDSYLLSLKTTLREAKDEAGSIDRRFVPKEDIPSFITMLEEKAAALGVKVDFGSINIEEGTTLDGILKLQITGSGTWSSAIGFIVALDSLPYASTIEEMRIYNPSAASENAPANSEWKFNVNLKQQLGKKI